MAIRNLALLVLAQCLSVSGTVVIVTLGGIVGAHLTPDPVLATLPMSIMVVGTAAATVFASMLMSRVGRRTGFATGALVALAGALVAAVGLAESSFAVFCLGIGLFGVNSAFVQQYRFAAVESVPSTQAGNAVSIVLVGSIGGALLGPYIATFTSVGAESSASDYLPAFYAIAAMQVVSALLVVALRTPETQVATHADARARPLADVVRQPRYIVAMLGGAVGYGAMTFVMTATPLSMHIDHGFAMADTADVIRSHVLAMYLPSLVAGPLVRVLGASRLMFLGVAIYAGTIAIGLQGHALHHYFWSLVLLGVGWNFLYVGSTALLVTTYRDSEKYGAQAVNEFTVFGASALASLSAGSVIHLYGWNPLLYSIAPALVVMVVGLAWLWRAREPQAAAVR